MMRRATIFIAALAVLAFAGAFSKPAAADVSFSFFYSNLSPYGTWAVSADYGRVWRPYDYEPGWNPYYDGHWVYTDYGWTWVSDYAWGSVPYHYGTWTLDPYMGWVWVPGYVWAPSWVVFSSGPDYIGWAPVPPRFVVGASIGFSTFAPERVVVVPARSFLAPRVRAYAVPRATVQVALSRTRIENNFSVQDQVVVNRGPDPHGIERAAGYSIRPMPISRVKNVTPSGRFDVDEVRADRHADGGGALRATAPEPARQPEASKQSETARPSETRQPETARRQEQAHAPQAGHPAHQEPAHGSQPPHRTEAARPPAHSGQPAHSGASAHSGPTPQAARPPSHDSQPNASHGPQGGPQQGGPHGQQGAPPPNQPTHGKPQQKPQQKPPKGDHGGG
jgi:hypothetical protein